MDVYQSVFVDTVFVVEPYIFAHGSYCISGKTAKGAKINIIAKSIENDTLKYTATFNKNKEMILSTNDSIVGIYNIVPNVVIE